MASIKVTARYFTTLREITGKREEQLTIHPHATIKNVLGELNKKYGKPFKDYVFEKEGQVQSHLQILVDGKSITFLNGLDTELKEGNTLAILPPAGGG